MCLVTYKQWFLTWGDLPPPSQTLAMSGDFGLSQLKVGVLLAYSGWRPGVLLSVLQCMGQPPREGVIRGMPRQPVALSVGCTCPCFRWFLLTGHQGFLVLFFKEDSWRGVGGTSC